MPWRVSEAQAGEFSEPLREPGRTPGDKTHRRLEALFSPSDGWASGVLSLRLAYTEPPAVSQNLFPSLDAVSAGSLLLGLLLLVSYRSPYSPVLFSPVVREHLTLCPHFSTVLRKTVDLSVQHFTRC